MPRIENIFFGQGVPEPYGRNRTSIGDNNMFGRRTPEPLSAPTQKLFKAIDDENLEAFKQALKEGADVNAFDKEGMTPLMSIVNVCAVSGDGQATLEKMAKLLIQNRSININAQSKQSVSTTRTRYDPSIQSEISEFITTSNMRKDTALHIACQVGAKDMVKILLTHPDIKTDIKNYEYKSPEDCIARGFERVIKLEFKKAQKANELLGALASRDFYQANMLLNEELNPNCWKRTRDGRIKTPLSLIIRSCVRTITEDKKEVLTKLLKHKDLDFSYEQYAQLKQTIEQAITERLTDTINRKDLDDVKELVEDNCFINRAIVTAALRDASEPTESVKNYLSEKFPTSAEQPVANTHNVQPEINDEFIAKELQQLENLRDELERTKAQLVEKEQELANKTSKISQLERDLKQVREERDRLSSENRLLRTKSLSNKNEKSSQAISPGKKQSNYAYAFFILSGALTGCVGLAILYDYLVIGACLTAVALVLFLVGYYLCKADERDIGPGGTTDNPQVTRVLISSPGPAENFCTC